MKSLIFTYEGLTHTNIGDYIQSLAARQFALRAGRDVMYRNRDELDSYTGPEAKAIMNGWFTHKPSNWPPSPLITPLFVSFHINSTAADKLLSDESIAYLRRHEPVGCRDRQTAKLLKAKGVDAYFSSCLTTTLGMTYGRKDAKRDKIYIVDPVHNVPETSGGIFGKLRFFMDYLLNFRTVNRYIRNLKSHNRYDLKFGRKYLHRFASITRSCIILSRILDKKDLASAIVLTQDHFNEEYPTNESRFERAEELLRMYSEARLVITSRIHCALPSLGLGTPVVFLRNDDDGAVSSCRFDGLLDLLNVIRFRKNRITDSPLRLPLDVDSVRNSAEYRKYADSLIEKCTEFCR